MLSKRKVRNFSNLAYIFLFCFLSTEYTNKNKMMVNAVQYPQSQTTAHHRHSFSATASVEVSESNVFIHLDDERCNSNASILDKNGHTKLRGGDTTAGLQHTLKVGFYFSLWYALNVIYNSKYKS